MRENKILIVDDEADVRQMCQLALQQIGITVDASASAEEGLELFKNARHPVVLLDNILPGMSGLELLEKIKTIAPETKVIMYSGVSTLEFEIDSIKRGAHSFITKPFAPHRLKEIVQQAL